MTADNGDLAKIYKLRRQLAEDGWDAREIARVILDLCPGVSIFASWRLGLGWSSHRSVEEMNRHLQRIPESRRRQEATNGIDVAKLGQWERWPRSGVRPEPAYLEAASHAYRVPISELGLDNGHHELAGDPDTLNDDACSA